MQKYITTKSGRKRVLNTPEEDAAINVAINDDPDTYEIADFSNLRPVGRPKAETTKERITIRLSQEVTQYFRQTGKGWQTRMDSVLREYVESHR